MEKLARIETTKVYLNTYRSIATAIYQNDPVEMAATGTITVAAATDVLLGSLNGVFFTDASTSKPTWAIT